MPTRACAPAFFESSDCSHETAKALVGGALNGPQLVELDEPVAGEPTAKPLARHFAKSPPPLAFSPRGAMQEIGRSRTANKELPIGSRVAHQKWVDHCQDLHRYRLATVRPTIDNKWSSKAGAKQPSYPHLSNNAKKTQVAGDLQAERELENYILLAKLSKILQREPANGQGGAYAPAAPPTSVPPSRALYSTQRYNELKRIHVENLKIVQRIQARQPHISTQALERDFEQSRKYKEMISLFGEQRVSRGSSVTPTPRSDQGAPGARHARARPASASVHRPAPPTTRPSSAGPTMMRRRQLDASAYRAASHDRAASYARGASACGPTSVWSEEAVPEEDGPPGAALTSDAQLGAAAD